LITDLLKSKLLQFVFRRCQF